MFHVVFCSNQIAKRVIHYHVFTVLIAILLAVMEAVIVLPEVLSYQMVYVPYVLHYLVLDV